MHRRRRRGAPPSPPGRRRPRPGPRWPGAGLTHESVGRRLAWFSAVMAALVGLALVVPLQYLAAGPGAVWCFVAGIAMARTARAG